MIVYLQILAYQQVRGRLITNIPTLTGLATMRRITDTTVIYRGSNLTEITVVQLFYKTPLKEFGESKYFLISISSVFIYTSFASSVTQTHLVISSLLVI